MLDITMALMRTLISSDHDAVPQQSVIATSVDTGFVDLIGSRNVFFNGRQIPERLMCWAKSEIRTNAVKKWFTDGSEVVFEFDRKKNGYYFGVKQNDKKRGFYSKLYRTLDEAAEDLFTLCDIVGVTDVQTINYRIMQAREKFSSSHC